MKKLFILVLVFSCHNVLKKPEFTVATPQGWIRKNTIDNNGSKVVDLILMPSKSNGGTHGNISILSTKASDLNEYINRYTFGLQNRYNTFILEEIGEREIAGILSRSMKYYIKSRLSKSGADVKVYFIPINGFVFNVICIFYNENIELYNNEINAVIKSFKFL